MDISNIYIRFHICTDFALFAMVLQIMQKGGVVSPPFNIRNYFRVYSSPNLGISG